MQKKMQLVSALAFGFCGLASAQSAESAKVAQAPLPRQMPSAAGVALPPSLSSSLTQQLTRAALLIHDQAPLWPAGAPKPVAVPKAAQAVTATPGASLLPVPLASLPQLPGAALIEQVASQATAGQAPQSVQTAQPKTAQIKQVKPVQAQAALVQNAPAKAPEAAQAELVHLQQQLSVSTAVSRVAAAAAQTALQISPPVAAPKAPSVQARTVQAAKSQPVKAPIAAPRPQPARAQGVASSPATSPVVSKPQRRGYSRMVKATAYSSDVGQTDSSPFVTATGTRVRPGVIALSRDLLRIFPYGSRVTLQDSAGLLNGRTFIVEDTMNVRMSNTIDIWMGSRAQAYQWGSRSVTITAIR